MTDDRRYIGGRDTEDNPPISDPGSHCENAGLTPDPLAEWRAEELSDFLEALQGDLCRWRDAAGQWASICRETPEEVSYRAVRAALSILATDLTSPVVVLPSGLSERLKAIGANPLEVLERHVVAAEAARVRDCGGCVLVTPGQQCPWCGRTA